VSADPAGRVRSGFAEPAAEVRAHGGGASRGNEAHLAHAGHGGVHVLHSRAVRRSGAPTSGHPVQPMDVQHSGVHSLRAADPRLVGRRVPTVAQLQHAILRVVERQVPYRSGAPVRHQSLPPGPGRRGCAAPDDGRRRQVRRQRPCRDANGCLGPNASNAMRLCGVPPAMTSRRRKFMNNIILYFYTVDNRSILE